MLKEWVRAFQEPNLGTKFSLEEGRQISRVDRNTVVGESVRGELEPFVRVTLVCPGEDAAVKGVWQWSTDHYLHTIYTELPYVLKRYCPATEEVWVTFVRLAIQELDPYFYLPTEEAR